MRVIAAAVLDPRGLLLVTKRAAPDVFYLPGGKPEPGEAPLDCLERELAEELGVGIAARRAVRRGPRARRARGRRDVDDRVPRPPRRRARRRRPRSRRCGGGRDDRGCRSRRRCATA